ncbi:MAG: hypothetical protein SFV81_10675 [Pirellulaceae bacterium]|nr:hypothetical protein [Pirellulaceae bacterium]
MEIAPYIVVYNGLVTGPCIRRCIDYLVTDGPSSYGGAVQRIELYPRCHTHDATPPGLNSMMEHFQFGLKSLPFIKFRRKSRLFEISYESVWIHSSEYCGESVIELPANDFNCLCREFATALLLIRKRLKDTDDFDLAAFQSQLRQRIDLLPVGTE